MKINKNESSLTAWFRLSDNIVDDVPMDIG